MISHEAGEFDFIPLKFWLRAFTDITTVFWQEIGRCLYFKRIKLGMSRMSWIFHPWWLVCWPIFSNLCIVTHSSFCFSLQFCFSSVLLLFLYICLVYIRDDVDEHRSEQRNNEQMSMLDSTTKSPLYLWMWFKSMLFLFCEIGSMQGAGWTSRF